MSSRCFLIMLSVSCLAGGTAHGTPRKAASGTTKAAGKLPARPRLLSTRYDGYDDVSLVVKKWKMPSGRTLTTEVADGGRRIMVTSDHHRITNTVSRHQGGLHQERVVEDLRADTLTRATVDVPARATVLDREDLQTRPRYGGKMDRGKRLPYERYLYREQNGQVHDVIVDKDEGVIVKALR
jgi:hypothetical protein